LLRDAGFKVDVQATDWQTVVSCRAGRKSPKEGGWNMFFTNWAGPEVLNPVVNVSISGRGKNGGWFGWFEDAKIKELRDKYVRSTSPDEQKKLTAEIQARAYEQVAYIPLGQYVAPSVWRKSLSGVLDGPATPVFWNIDKAEYSGLLSPEADFIFAGLDHIQVGVFVPRLSGKPLQESDGLRAGARTFRTSTVNPAASNGLGR
jgi:ABC-type transport system substrate-binding protein